MTASKALKLMTPQPCPVQLIRIGGDRDGAYLVPDDLEEIGGCFSPGVNNFKYFEDELAIDFGIPCHMCDYSSDINEFKTPLVPGLQTFEKKWLDIDNGDDSISLSEWVHRHAPDPTVDLILQIDIEGAEYRNLLSADQKLLARFRIIVIELHGLDALKAQDDSAIEILRLLEKLNASHVCVHAHPNNCSVVHIDNETGMNVPSVIELTYLRRDRFRSTAFIREPQIPHPLDISRNVAFRPPIHLNTHWTSKEISSASAAKITSDKLDFAEHTLNELRSEFRSDVNNLLKLHSISTRNLLSFYEQKTRRHPHSMHPEDGLGAEVAIGKKYLLSTSYVGHPREGFVHPSESFFFHTAFAINQSITIDLEVPRSLAYLIIVNRRDSCQERAKGLFFVIHNKEMFRRQKALPIVAEKSFYDRKSLVSSTPLAGRKGRFVTIFSALKTALHFSSVEIYAD